MGNVLCAYLCGGPVSDHEVRVADELVEKLRMGMHVNIKSSSLSDTVQEFMKGIHETGVWMMRPGHPPVPGALTFG